MKERVSLEIDSSLLEEIDFQVDGDKVKDRSHAVELMLMRNLGKHVPKVAVILAGGEGTRMRPLTFEIPKPLLIVHDRTLIEHLFDLFRKHGIKEIVLSIGYKGEKIRETLGNGKKFGVNINYVEEKEPMGTAGPLKLAGRFLKDTFVCSNADELKEPDLMDMYLFHKKNGAVGTIALTKIEDPSAYGVARLRENKILEFIEKPKKEDAPSKLINSGIYMLEPEILDYIPEGYAMLEKDVFPRLAKEGKLCGYPFSGQWFNTGTPEHYEEAIKEWRDIE